MGLIDGCFGIERADFIARIEQIAEGLPPARITPRYCRRRLRARTRRAEKRWMPIALKNCNI